MLETCVLWLEVIGYVWFNVSSQPVSQIFVVGSINFLIEAAAIPLQATTCSTDVPVNVWDESNFLSLWGF